MKRLLFAALVALGLTLPSPARAEPISVGITLALIETGIGFSAAIFIGQAVVGIASAFLIGTLTSLLTPKPKAPNLSSLAREQGITQLVRSSVEPQRVIWGERIVSGPMVFAATAGSTGNDTLNLVIALTGHQVEDIGDVFLNDVRVTPAQLDGDGAVQSGRFAGKLDIRPHLGADDQAADAELVSKVAEWTTAHRLRGVAYLYTRLHFDRDVYPTGIPNIKALVKGRKVMDPRDTAIGVTSSSVAAQTTVTTGSAHGLSVGGRFRLWGHTGSVPALDGEHQVLTAPSPTTLTIDVDVTTGGSGGSLRGLAWSDNAALALLDYLVADFGLAASLVDEIDEASFVAAANTSDEEVALTASLPTFDFTADAASDELTQSVAGDDKPKPLHRGDGVEATTTGTLPAGLSLATRYFAIPVTATTYKLATTLAGARAGTAIDITDAGSGTHTLTRKSQPRYTVNGAIALDERPIEIVNGLTQALAGALVYTGGKYALIAGGYTGPASVTLDESDLRGPVTIRPRPAKRDVHNAVRGTFIDRDNAWQPSEFPPLTNATYEAADGGERIFKDIELRHATDTHRAQRLAKLTNERDRQGMVIDFPAKLTALELAVMDTVDLDLDRGPDSIFSGKEFEVVGWTLSSDGGIDLVLKETAAAVYAWDPDAEETVVDLAPNTSLPSAFDVPAAPTALVLMSGAAELLLPGDGTIITRIKASWTAPLDTFVTSGGRIEVAAKKSADADWTPQPSVAGDATFTFVGPVDDGVAWDVRLRSVNQVGVTSAWVTSSNHTVIGKTALPADVTGFTAAQNGDVVNLRWNAVADADLKGYDVRYGPRGASSFADATPIGPDLVAAGTIITTALVPPGDWTFYNKAVDTSKNRSANAATFDAVVANTFDVIISAEEAPEWTNLGQGSGTGFVKHYTGVLVPDSQDLTSVGGFAVFDQFVPNPVASAIYEAPEIDIDFDDTLRVFADIVSALGPGETAGTADPEHRIDFRKAADSYDGFEAWPGGNVEARFIKSRIVLTPADGVAKVSGFNTVADLKERTEGAKGVTIAAAGSAVAFARRFHETPRMKVMNAEASAKIPGFTAVTTTGFTGHVFNTGGSDVGGTVDWEATGA